MPLPVDRQIADLLSTRPRAEHCPGLSELGQELLDVDDADGALACFDRALRIDQACLLAWVGRADALARKNRAGEALGCLDRALARDFDFLPAIALKAKILESLGCHAEAEEARRKLAPPPPRRRSSTSMRATRKSSRPVRRVSTPPKPAARVIARIRKPKALVAIEEPAPSRPELEVPDLDLGALLAAERDLAEGRSKDALRAVEPLVNAHPDDGALQVLRGRALRALGAVEHATRSADEAVRLDPTKASAWKLAARCALAQKRHAPALEAIERAYGLAATDPEVHRIRGDVLVAAERHLEAVYAYEKAVHYRADDASAWLELGRTLRLLRRASAAEKALGNAIAAAREANLETIEAEATALLARVSPS